MAQTLTAARRSREKDRMRVVTTSCGRLGSWRNVHRHDGSIKWKTGHPHPATPLPGIPSATRFMSLLAGHPYRSAFTL